MSQQDYVGAQRGIFDGAGQRSRLMGNPCRPDPRRQQERLLFYP